MPPYPNPFNPSTQLEFFLPRASELELKVFDLLGREVASIAQGSFAAGTHSFPFHGSDLASGVYFAALIVDAEQLMTQKLLLMK